MENLSGDGGLPLFNAELTEENEISNRLEILHAESGTHTVRVTSASGSDPTKEEMKGCPIRIVDDEGAAFAADRNRPEYGMTFRDYALRDRISDAGDREWYLTFMPQQEGDLTPTGETEAALSGPAGHYALWYGQLTDLRKRLGEVRCGTQTCLRVAGFSGGGETDAVMSVVPLSFHPVRTCPQPERLAGRNKARACAVPSRARPSM